MVAKCANPQCNAEFRYLKQGKLFLAEHAPSTRNNGTTANHLKRTLQHYWLCDACSQHHTIQRDDDEVRIVPKHARKPVTGQRARRSVMSA
jgi:hypothetical protein